LCARQLPTDWEKRYGYRPLLLETLVDANRFRGTCYRAANWIALGRTQGRGRMDRHHMADRSAPKDVYVYPLCRNVQQRLCTAVAPAFSGVAEEQQLSRLLSRRPAIARRPRFLQHHHARRVLFSMTAPHSSCRWSERWKRSFARACSKPCRTRSIKRQGVSDSQLSPLWEVDVLP